MKKKTMAQVAKSTLAMVLSISMLTGCSALSGNSVASSSATASTVKAEPLGKQSQLTVLTRGVPLDPNQKYPTGQTLEDNAYTRMLKKDFNIDIQNTFSAATSGDNYKSKVDLAIASGTIPDYLTNLTYTQYKAIVKAGLAMDISTVWDQYASSKTKEIYKSNQTLFDSLVKSDGKMYAIPASNPDTDFLQVIWARKDWMDKLGLKAPSTLSDLENIAKEFATKDPDGNGKADTVGLAGPTVNGNLYQDMINTNFAYNFDPIFSSFNSFPGIWTKGSDGKAVYGSILPETKTALKKLAEMYKNGEIAPGMLTSKSEELIASNKCGLFVGPWWIPMGDLGNSWKNDKKANWQPYLLSGSDGTYLAKGGNAAQSFTVISKNCKNPEAVIKMLNIFKEGLSKYVPEAEQTVLGDSAYPMYMTFSLKTGPAMVMTGLSDYYNGKKTKEQVNSQFSNYDAYINQAFNKIVASKTKPYTNTDISGWDFSGTKADDYGWVWAFGVGLRPYSEGKFKFVTSLTYENTATMDKAWANLSNLEKTTFSKIIVGQASIDTFDSFVTQWKSEGGSQVTQEIQQSLGK